VTWEMLLRAGWQPDARQKLISGGEALRPGLAAELTKDGAALWNFYGPTETTVYSTFFRVDGARPSVPIGDPIANTQVYVVDRHLNPVPFGMTGELLIGGLGLARGYHARPALTAERFIPDPFAVEPGARLYRTGDVARRLGGGELECLGRTDYQVKLRGFRIELGEVESVLCEHPAVSEAVVAVREARGGGERLVAYFVPAAPAAPADGELRAHLKRRLPDYMLPSAFVPLAALPLTTSGKIDRRRLAEIDVAAPRGGGEYEEPRTPAEKLLAGIWRDLLGAERVGVRDNFFALGGHSLLAARLMAEVSKVFGVQVGLRSIFEEPTVAGLAEIVEAELIAEMERLSDAEAESLL
jgi:acyl-coenzyme A synthetase/AMP-(fatty) acid ligase/acyl carrier protein